MPTTADSGGFFNFGNPRFIKGALIGALATYILTNEKVQQGAIRGAVKAWSLVQGGVEEMKERFRDAEAELHAGRMEE
jgi:translation initiation factor 2 alpha subunit (eIF-2alpha)